ncbi:MAG: NAD(P)/FAD-dependent oxidoreductase [Acidilobaceae archaeon]
MPDRFYIIGGGPGGVGAAYAISKAGFKPVIIEVHDRLAVKPCGRGVPVTSDIPFVIPKSIVLNKISYVKLYVDRLKLFKAGGWLNGFIIDKREFLEHILSETRADIYYRARYNHKSGVARLGGETIDVRRGIFSGGFPYYEGERIPVVQYILGGSLGDVEMDTIEIYFDTEILGYYYVFPHGDNVEVGVGGFRDHNTLWKLLDKFISEDSRLKNSIVVEREAAVVSIGGLKLGYINGLVKVGEAAGYVLPLTGEGIRPSIISGYIAGEALAKGLDPIRELRRLRLSEAISIQRRLLEWAKRLSVEERRRLISTLTPQAHAEIALGYFRLHKLVQNLIFKPLTMVKILTKIIGL